jgi:hypothetical protein
MTRYRPFTLQKIFLGKRSAVSYQQKQGLIKIGALTND